jgi:hypothetical protein
MDQCRCEMKRKERVDKRVGDGSDALLLPPASGTQSSAAASVGSQAHDTEDTLPARTNSRASSPSAVEVDILCLLHILQNIFLLLILLLNRRPL